LGSIEIVNVKQGGLDMTDYIKEMRAVIGKKPLMLVGTSIIAYKDDMILLQKRADFGTWAYPGGLMELGEEPEVSAKREFREETGLIAQDIRLFGVFGGEKRHFCYPNGDEVYITDIVYTCSKFIDSGESHDDEVIDLKWFPVYALPHDLMPTVEDVINKFITDYYGSMR